MNEFRKNLETELIKNRCFWLILWFEGSVLNKQPDAFDA